MDSALYALSKYEMCYLSRTAESGRVGSTSLCFVARHCAALYDTPSKN